MKRCVYDREREVSLKPIEILSGCAIRIGLSKHFTLKKSETWGKFAKKYFSKKLASEHACIIN
jgi:hypothetical protein